MYDDTKEIIKIMKEEDKNRKKCDKCKKMSIIKVQEILKVWNKKTKKFETRDVWMEDLYCQECAENGGLI